MPNTAFGGQSQQRWPADTLNKHNVMQDMLLFDVDGQPRATMAARKVGPLVLAFFHTGCETSRLVLPYLQRLADAYAETKKLTVWGVSQDDTGATRDFAGQLGLTFPILLDRDVYHSMMLGVVSVPTVFLVSSDGEVVRKMAGWDKAGLNTISEEVARLTEAPEPAVIVAPNDPAPARRFGCGSRRAASMV